MRSFLTGLYHVSHLLPTSLPFPPFTPATLVLAHLRPLLSLSRGPAPQVSAWLTTPHLLPSDASMRPVPIILLAVTHPITAFPSPLSFSTFPLFQSTYHFPNILLFTQSCFRPFALPWTAVRQASLSFTISQSSLPNIPRGLFTCYRQYLSPLTRM